MQTLTLVQCMNGEESGAEMQLEPFCEWLHLRDDYDGDYPDYGEFQMDPDEREDGLENDEGVENDGQEDGEEET